MTKKVALISIQSVLILAIMYFLLVHVKLPLGDIVIFLTSTNYRFYGSLLLFTLFMMMQGWIWVQILNDSGKYMPFFQGLSIFINSQFVKYLPAGAFLNYVGRVYYTSRIGIPLKPQLVTIFYENVLLVIAASSYAIILGYQMNLVHGYLVILFFTMLAASVLFYQPYTNILEKGVHRFIKKFRGIQLTLSRKSFFTYLIYFLISHAVMGWAFWFLLRSFGIHHVGFFYAAGTFAAAWLIGLISPLPGGLGVREGVLVTLLLFQVDRDTAIQISVIARIWNILAEVLFFMLINSVQLLRKRWEQH